MRKIENIDDVVNTLLKAGHNNVQVVDLTKHTFEEQLHIVFCTDILVGVQGAGLTW